MPITNKFCQAQIVWIIKRAPGNTETPVTDQLSLNKLYQGK